MDITAKLYKYIEEPQHIDEGVISGIRKFIKMMDKLDIGKAKRDFKNGFDTFSELAVKSGQEDKALSIINNLLGTKFRSLDDISNLKILKESMMAEGLGGWWNKKKDSLSNKMASKPFLKAYNQLLTLPTTSTGMAPVPSTGNTSVTMLYALVWSVLVVSKTRGD